MIELNELPKHDSNQNINNHISDFRYIKEARNPDVYTPVLQKLNSTRQKYGHAQYIFRKVWIQQQKQIPMMN